MCKVPEIPPIDEGDSPSSIECPGAGSYCFCLERAAQATAQGDVQLAILWIRQAELVGSTTEKREKMPEVLSAYGRLINDCCLQMRNLTIRSGNITPNHERSAAQIEAISDQVCRLLESTDQSQKALVLQGLARNLIVLVGRARQTNPLVTCVKEAGSLLSELTLIQDSLKQLGMAPSELYGSGRELLELARVAVSNAEFSLTWFFPARLSLWDKADFMCRQADQLLTIYLSTGVSDKPQPEFASLKADLKGAQEALTRHSYREASGSLQRSGKTLESCIAALD